MKPHSRKLAGWLFLLLPLVPLGGVDLVTLLAFSPTYLDNPLRQDLWRAGHAHAGVILILSLLVIIFAEQAALSTGWKKVVRCIVPASAFLLPIGFVLSMLSPDAVRPNAFIYLTYLGAVLIITGLVILGVGLLRASRAQTSGEA